MLLKDKYEIYDEALKEIGLEDLKTRRIKLAVKFGKGCLKIDQMKDLFSKNKDMISEIKMI